MASSYPPLPDNTKLKKLMETLSRSMWLAPQARNLSAAGAAFAVDEVSRSDREDVPLYNRFLAARAPRRLRAFQSWDVADINVVEPFLTGGLARLHQRLDGRGCQVLQLVLRMEAREM